MPVREVLAGFEVGSPTLTVGITIPWHEVPGKTKGEVSWAPASSLLCFLIGNTLLLSFYLHNGLYP